MEGYVTAKEAAERLNIQHNALLRRVQRGSVKALKVGSIWLVPEIEITRVLSNKQVSHDN